MDTNDNKRSTAAGRKTIGAKLALANRLRRDKRFLPSERLVGAEIIDHMYGAKITACPRQKQLASKLGCSLRTVESTVLKLTAAIPRPLDRDFAKILAEAKQQAAHCSHRLEP